MFKLKIKYKAPYEIVSIAKGDWVDLKNVETVVCAGPAFTGRKKSITIQDNLINLGIAMQLPKGYEAVLLPRSSTFKMYGMLLANSQGVIDNSYCGNNDIWRFPAVFIKESYIESYSRIAQFRIQLSQKATIWQKLKWLFINKIEFVKVDSLSNNNRGGFGTTGKK